MKISTRLFAIAFTIAAAALFSVTARAQTPTVITNLPYTITTNGNYVLNSNLTSTATSGNLITVSVSNVSIDMQNHYIAGPTGNDAITTIGIFANGQSNITIQNGTISYCSIAIKLSQTASTNNVGQRIDNMRINHCTFQGIFLYKAPSARITNCQVTEIGGTTTDSAAYGMNVIGAGATVMSCIVSDVTASTAADAVGIIGDSDTYARNNEVTSCYTGISFGNCQGNMTYGCTTAFTTITDDGNNN